MNKENIKIAIIGLGYVGLPLARLFATKFPVIGYDINGARVKELQKGHDSTLEVEDDLLKAVLVKNMYEFHKQAVLEVVGGGENMLDESPNEGRDNGLFVSRDLGIYLIATTTSSRFLRQ